MNARPAAIRSPRSASGFPAFDLQSLSASAALSGSAPPIVATVSNECSAQSDFRALILAAMRERRAVLIDRAKEARANRQRKLHSICEAEIAALTNGLLFMELANG